MDFVNAGAKKLILWGTAKAVINPAVTPQEREKRISEVVSKILEKFLSLQPDYFIKYKYIDISIPFD